VRRLILLLLMCCPAAFGQVLNITAGQSTLYGGAGAGVTAYLPNSTVYMGAGFANGQFNFGLSDSFLYKGFTTTAGDKTFGYGDLSLSVRGLSVQRATATQTVAGFVGFTGTANSLPFFQATRAQRGGAGIYYKRIFGGLQLSGLAALDGGQRRTALGTATYTGRVLGFTVTGGKLANLDFFNGSMVYSPARWLHFYAGRQDVLNGLQRATINSGGAGLSFAHFTAQAQVYSGTAAGRAITGQSAGGGLRWRAVSVSSAWYSAAGHKVLAHTASETFRHWQVTETLAGKNVSFGGGFHNNHVSISLDHSMSFLPFAGRAGFQQTTAVRVSLHIPHSAATLDLGSVVLPNGRTRYTVSGGDYINGPLHTQAGTQAARARSIGGKYVISGKVTDGKTGMPVLGAGVQLGRATVYTVEDGTFFLRVRNTRPVPVFFVVEGMWHAVSCPATAQPGTPVNIAVSR
jgi:hypothetical protein